MRCTILRRKLYCFMPEINTASTRFGSKIWDPAITAGIGQFGAVQTAAPSLGMEVSPIDVRDAGEIERAVTAFAYSSNGGLIVTASPGAIVHRDLIVTLAAPGTSALRSTTNATSSPLVV